MNRRRFHHWMTRSALAATLALVLVPTLGRLVGLPAMPVLHVAMQSATPDAGHGNGHHVTEPASNAHPGMGEDCDYCALLMGTASLPVPTLHTSLPRLSIAVAVPQTGAPRLDRHPTGLGSRGPPLAG